MGATARILHLHRLLPPLRASTREKHGGVEGWHTAESSREKDGDRASEREVVVGGGGGGGGGGV